MINPQSGCYYNILVKADCITAGIEIKEGTILNHCVYDNTTHGYWNFDKLKGFILEKYIEILERD